ncbi:MAG: RluA family pseudouridine synthase [Saprospiraceae bacterium]|jgi:23S rRNA pseudouridine1911/1915/1917 synthase|nr:RluA family pseudouridine synthase [Saprospiraceae bacterium]
MEEIKKVPISELILYKDHHIVAVNKPSGMPSQEDPSGDKSVLRLAEIYTKQKLFLCNRLDRPVSGVILLGKSPRIQTIFQDQMQQGLWKKSYIAIVPFEEADFPTSLKHFVKKSGQKAQIRDDEAESYQAAELQCISLATSDKYRLLELRTGSGKFHQIRAQLAHAGYPIRGDVKYGARRSNKDRSIGLHAWKISLYHPITQQEMNIVTPVPTHDIWPVFATNIEALIQTQTN